MNGPGVEIVSKHPVFTEGKQMTGCCLRVNISLLYRFSNLRTFLLICYSDIQKTVKQEDDIQAILKCISFCYKTNSFTVARYQITYKVKWVCASCSLDLQFRSFLVIPVLQDGVMYKPGATFFDGNLEKTLVCCSGSNIKKGNREDIKELSFCHKLKFLNSYIFTTCRFKILKFKTQIIYCNRILIMKYRRSTKVGCNDIVI